MKVLKGGHIWFYQPSPINFDKKYYRNFIIKVILTIMKNDN